MEERGLGVKLDGEWCEALLYANDIVKLAEVLEVVVVVVGYAGSDLIHRRVE